MNLEALARHFEPFLRDYVAQETKSLQDEINNLRAKLDDLPAPAKGDAGKDADEDAIVERVIKLVPVPKDGAPGKDGVGIVKPIINRSGELILTLSDGRSENLGVVVGQDGKDGERGDQGPAGADANVEHLKSLIEALGAGNKGIDLDALKALIPTPVAGEKGAKGDRGEDGRDGASAYEIAVRAGFSGSESEWMKSLIGSTGKDGINGKDGAGGINGKDGMSGKDGAAGINGKDGVGIEDVHIDQEGSLHIRLTTGERKTLGRVVGEKGDPGKDGLGFDDFRMEFDGERTLTAVYERGDDRRQQSFILPTIVDRGVYKAGKTYAQGDGVSFAGAFWIAQAETAEKPGDGAGWRLAVKKGRDGRDGKDGDKGDKGEQGRAGRDLTQTDGDGNKW
jgi:collagen type III alpha